MPVIAVTQPADGQTADANDVNSQVNAILAVANGHLDQDNLADGGVTNAKLAGSIDVSKLAASAIAGWASLGNIPSSITYNGNRNYSVVFNGVDLTPTLSPGQRLKFTRTVAAPTQSTSLNGTTQYFSNTSATGMSFTNNFVVSAWIKLASYPTTAAAGIASRYDGTSGWRFTVETTGQIQLVGFNAGSSNFSLVVSTQTVPLNKWVHVAAQLDMLTFTGTPTTSYVMIDGIDTGATVARSGTNPTALVQAGNINIGSYNSGAANSFFPGKIAQVAIYSAKVTQATIVAASTQTLVGTETSLISAYSFNNSINDLNANANNLTANGSAVATNADSPFAGGTNATGGFTAGTTEYGEVFDISFSTNTTLTVQVPSGYMLPTSGGVSAVAYSATYTPLGWPGLGTIIGFVLLGSNFTTTSTSIVALGGLTKTVYIPRTGRPIRVTFYSTSVNNNSGNPVTISLWDGTVGSGIEIESGVSAINATSNNATALTIETPPYFASAGSHTFNIGVQVSTSGTATVVTAAGTSAYLLIETT